MGSFGVQMIANNLFCFRNDRYNDSLQSATFFPLDMFIAGSESAVLFKELIGRMSKCESLHFLESVVKMCSQRFGCERVW